MGLVPVRTTSTRGAQYNPRRVETSRAPRRGRRRRPTTIAIAATTASTERSSGMGSPAAVMLQLLPEPPPPEPPPPEPPLPDREVPPAPLLRAAARRGATGAAGSEDVRRALPGVRPDQVAGCTDEGGAAAHRHRSAEVVARDAVARGELGLLRPRGAALHEDVRRAVTAVGAGTGAEGTDDGRAAAHRHRVAEAVARRAVARGELGLLGPGGAALHEDVRRALAGVWPTDGPWAPTTAVPPLTDTE